jgi:hypothetical protein
MILDTIRDTESQFRITVRVNRSRSPQQAIEATGRALNIDREVVASMPKGDGDEVEIVFFKIVLFKLDIPKQHCLSDSDLKNEYLLRGLRPADPISIAAVNEADPAFADRKPHTSHWKDAKGCWCYITFHCWGGKREVVVHSNNDDHKDNEWFAGIRADHQS